MANESNELYYDREKLYSDVWKHSLAALCKQYGVLHVELVKACKTLNVPRPPVGYWTQKEHGKASSAPELPPFNNPPLVLIHPPKKEKKIKIPLSPKNVTQDFKAKPDEKKVISEQAPDLLIEQLKETNTAQSFVVNNAVQISKWLDLIPQKDCIFPHLFEEAKILIERETYPEMTIVVPQKIEKEHIYVKHTRVSFEKKLKNFKQNQYTPQTGQIYCYGKDRFQINVGPDSIQRVVKILQALCEAAKKRDFIFVNENMGFSNNYQIHLLINGEKIAFSISDNYEKIELDNGTRNYYSNYKYVSTGKLSFKIVRTSFQWDDTDESTLENKLNDIVAGLIFCSVLVKENEAQRKKDEEERKRSEAIKEENERLARINKQRIVNFKKATEYWIQYQDMFAFLSMVKRDYKKSIKKDKETTNWIKWASDYLVICKNKYENLVCYNVEEYKEEREVTSTFRSTYNPPPEEPYNYWKKPWYQKR